MLWGKKEEKRIRKSCSEWENTEKMGQDKYWCYVSHLGQNKKSQ